MVYGSGNEAKNKIEKRGETRRIRRENIRKDE
jgi:hypothetical protein